MDWILYYVVVGFVLNTGLALWNFYVASEGGYVILPHPFIYFLTMFAWPKTLWDIIVQRNDNDAE